MKRPKVQVDANGVGGMEGIKLGWSQGFDWMNWMPSKNVDDKLTFDQ